MDITRFLDGAKGFKNQCSKYLALKSRAYFTEAKPITEMIFPSFDSKMIKTILPFAKERRNFKDLCI